MPRWTLSLSERFWSKVNKTDTCWNWTAYKNKKGYGDFGMGATKTVASHRFSWELHFGPIPDGLCVCHHCDNPACVRPDHLFLGTQADNGADMRRKKRERHPSGGEASGAKLSLSNVLEIRSTYRPGDNLSRIARKYGVHRITIYDVVQYKTWKEATS